MMRLIRKFFPSDARRATPPPPSDLVDSQRMARPFHEPPESLEIEPRVAGLVVSNGPGKNILIRTSRQKRAGDTPPDGLELLDESAAGSRDADGNDPYNTGKFDRSRNWDKRFRK